MVLMKNMHTYYTIQQNNTRVDLHTITKYYIYKYNTSFILLLNAEF